MSARLAPGLAMLAAATFLLSAGASSGAGPAAVHPAQIATGGLHSCAVTTGGAVQCWGWNKHGELGDGTTKTQATPVSVRGLTGVRAIAVGGSDETYEGSDTCALTRAGTVSCWGWNGYGSLGDGTRIDRHTPVPVRGLSRGATAITAGGESISRGAFNCARMANGTVRCWGSNGSGQLGDGTRRTRTEPVQVHGLRGARAVAAGGSFACAVTHARTVKCWGDNQYGQLGDGTTHTRLTPVLVSRLRGVRALALEGESSCAITSAAGVKCWGYNSEGELGNDSTADRRHPGNVAGLTRGVKQIAGGGAHGCALLRSGRAMCWGFNPYGQLGDGTTAERHRPTFVRGLSGSTAIAAGSSTTCSVGQGGAKCWGANKFGQVGNGKRSPALTPSAVVGLGARPCIVPNVTGLTLTTARRAIHAGGCRPGLVRLAASSVVPRGQVVSQSPGPDARLGHAGEVHLVVSNGPTPPPGTELDLPHGSVVDGLSADGHRVAVHVIRVRPERCHDFLVWRGRGAPKTIRAGCSSNHDRPVSDFALAGTRVAWGAYDYGNHIYCYVLTATAARPRPVDTGFCGGDSGTFVGHFSGGDGLLVFNAWGVLRGLYVLHGNRARLIKVTPGKAISVSAGRIGVRERGGAIAVYRSSGALVHRFRAHLRTAALDGSTLVGATKTAIRPYSLSGRPGRARRMTGARPRLAGAAGGIALYVTGPSVHLLRLSDGKDVTIRITQRGRPFAQITRAGLYTASRTRVAFLPTTAVRELFAP